MLALRGLAVAAVFGVGAVLGLRVVIAGVGVVAVAGLRAVVPAIAALVLRAAPTPPPPPTLTGRAAAAALARALALITGTAPPERAVVVFATGFAVLADLGRATAEAGPGAAMRDVGFAGNAGALSLEGVLTGFFIDCEDRQV